MVTVDKIKSKPTEKTCKSLSEPNLRSDPKAKSQRIGKMLWRVAVF